MRARLITATFATIALVAAMSTPAIAYSTYPWYGPNPPYGSCWQTSNYPASSGACDIVGAHYLASHMRTGGVFGDLSGSPSGDYCNGYNMASITTPQSVSLGGFTGFTTPRPYAGYQLSNRNASTCQASGSRWGYLAVKPAPGPRSECWLLACGVHHLASMQSEDARPWSPAFGNPSLEVGLLFRPQTFTRYSNSAAGWAYVCPLLQDRSTGNVLEYCVELWQGMAALPNWPNIDAVGATSDGSHCQVGLDNSNVYRPLDQVSTSIRPGVRFITKQSNSSNTLIAPRLGGTYYFHFTISTTNLVAAINADNQACNYLAPDYSPDPANYRLVGIENGTEGWGDFYALGSSSARLTVNTLYGRP